MDLPTLTPQQMAEDRSATVIGVVTMCFVVASSMLGLRLWTRIQIVKQTGADDWVAAVSLVSLFRFARDGCVFIHASNKCVCQ